MTDTTASGESDLEEAPHFEVDPYERRWMLFSIVMLLVFLTTVTVAGFFMGIQVNGEEQRVNPQTLAETEPWSNPGLREVGDGKYVAYIVARTWAFEPNQIEIPVGATVDIYVTSPDLQHGLKVADTNVNVQVVPGQVSKLTYTFDKVGSYPFICHEYCGTAHASMFGTINVVNKEN